MIQPAATKIEIVRAMPCDLAGVRALQEKNHKDNLPQEKRADGYISLRTELPLLERIRRDIGIVACRSDCGIAGFELPLDKSHRLEARGENDVILPTFYSITYRGKAIAEYCWVSGQYCVDAPFRGMGIPGMMHPEFLDMLKGRFELLVFIVASTNTRSLHVAKDKFGMVEATGNVLRTWKTLVQEIKD